METRSDQRKVLPRVCRTAGDDDKSLMPPRKPFTTFRLASDVAFNVGGGGYLYFIGADEDPVKIGYSANPKARLRQLQTASPYKLRVLAQIAEGQDLEAHYHRRFAAHRLHGEWFARCAEVETEIARLEDSCRRAAA